MNIPTLKEVEDRIGQEAMYWAGNCYGVACAMNDAFPELEGVALYGHFNGNIVKGSIFYRQGLVQHGWIELPNGSVVDPTRWAFDQPNSPYIYHGSDDDYDEGGNAFRKMSMDRFPAYDQHRNLPDFDPPLTQEMIAYIGADSRWSDNQVFWLASQEFKMVGIETYQYIINNYRHGRGAIPTDNYKRVQRLTS